MTAPSDRRFEGRLAAAVDGLDGRRVVRRDANRILVSKFEDGFAAALHASLARVPELFELRSVEAAYGAVATAQTTLRRVEAWHLALAQLLAELGEARGLTREQQAQVLAGIDSVAALLDSILWSEPGVGDDYAPHSGEEDAYREAVARMDATPGIFTRFYGIFAGARVENHCPGAPFARLLLAQAWTACTGWPPPA
ncbi:MAG TPA: hypothetical protein VFA70_13040 [Dehalococcoidia bacterium]|jgi:hypothetical protein|nr:hypothetical protein [Dehalococcoidia bacterium]